MLSLLDFIPSSHSLVISLSGPYLSKTNDVAYGIVLDDCNFHESVQLTEFEQSKTLILRPPDGEVDSLLFLVPQLCVLLRFQLSLMMDTQKF